MGSTKTRALIGLLAILAPEVLFAQEPSSSYYYYYFDSKRSLALDVERIALSRTEALGAPQAPDLRPFGIAPGQLAAWTIPGWWLATNRAPSRSPSALEDLVAELATHENLFVSPVFTAEDGGPVVITREILLGFDEDVLPRLRESIIANSGAGTVLERDWANMPGVYHLRSHARNGFDVLAEANALAERPEVKFAEPNFIFTGREVGSPNDPGFPDCWGIHNTGQFNGVVDMDMDGPEAWAITNGDPDILVLVIDNGVEQDHPDIHQVFGHDTTSDHQFGGPVNNCDDHGTAVAGCISAILNNDLGTVGIAPGARVASGRAHISNLGCNGTFTAESKWVVSILTWAETQGVRVTNNSNTYGLFMSAIASKYAQTRTSGIVHFAAAGNDGSGKGTLPFPAVLESVNSVAALRPNGQLTGFSNFGFGLALSAPGTLVYTTDRTGSAGYSGGDYAFVSGTSFASPYTAGVAALILSFDDALDAEQVEFALRCGAVDLGPPGYDTTFGWGFVNAEQSLSAIGCEPCPPVVGLICSSTEEDIALDWSNADMYTSIFIFRNSELREILPGNAETYTDPNVLAGSFIYEVQGSCGDTKTEPTECRVDHTPPCDPVNLACFSIGDAVGLSWGIADQYESIQIFRDSELIATLPGDATTHVEQELAAGTYRYGVEAHCIGGGVASAATCELIHSPICNAVTALACRSVDDDLFLSWQNTESYTSLRIVRNSAELAMLSGTSTSFLDAALPAGVFTYEVVGDCGGLSVAAPATCTLVHGALPEFVRGDATGDGIVNGLVDSLYILQFQFQEGEPPLCLESADADGNGAFNGLIDAFFVLAHQFQNGAPPPLPYPDCGPDPEPTLNLGCGETPACSG